MAGSLKGYLNAEGQLVGNLNQEQQLAGTLNPEQQLVGTINNKNQDYLSLINKPSINGHELSNDSTLADIGFVDSVFDVGDKEKLDGLTNYVLPIATDTILGGVRQGENVTIDEFGYISSSAVQDAAVIRRW